MTSVLRMEMIVWIDSTTSYTPGSSNYQSLFTNSCSCLKLLIGRSRRRSRIGYRSTTSSTPSNASTSKTIEICFAYQTEMIIRFSLCARCNMYQMSTTYSSSNHPRNPATFPPHQISDTALRHSRTTSHPRSCLCRRIQRCSNSHSNYSPNSTFYRIFLFRFAHPCHRPSPPRFSDFSPSSSFYLSASSALVCFFFSRIDWNGRSCNSYHNTCQDANPGSFLSGK